MEKTLLTSSITFWVTQDASSKGDIAPRDIEAFLEPPLSASVAPDGNITFASIRKQIQLEIRKSRIHVADLSGRPIADSLAPGAAVQALRLQGGQVNAITYGLQLEIGVNKTAGAFIAQQLLNMSRLSAIGKLQAESVTVLLETPTGTFEVTLEPRFGKTDAPVVFAAVNVKRSVESAAAILSDPARLGAAFSAATEEALAMAAKVIGEPA